MSKEQEFSQHWLEWLLKLSDGGIHWGALEDMYLQPSEDEKKDG